MLKNLAACTPPSSGSSGFLPSPAVLGPRDAERILVDAARKRSAARHGGGHGRIHLEDVAHLNLSSQNDKQLIALNDALDELAKGDPRKARIVEMRHFGGLSVSDTAAVLKVSEETVTRDWRLARRWLLLQIRPQAVPGVSNSRNE